MSTTTQRNVRVVFSGEDNATATTVGVARNLRLMRDESEQAGKGLGKIGNVLGDISREAIGASGPLGRVAEKLIEFGLGGGLFIAVAGGLSAIAIAYEKLEETANKAHKAYTDWLDSVRHESPLAIIGAELDAQTEKLKNWEESTKGFVLDAGAQAALQRQRDLVAQLGAQYNGLREQLHSTAVAHAEAHGPKPTAAIRTQIGAIHDYTDALAGLNRTFDEWLRKQKEPGGLFTISSVLGRDKTKTTVPEVDLSGLNATASAAGQATLDTLAKNSPEQMYADALKPLQAFNDELERQGHIFDGVVSPGMSGTIDGITGIADALAKAGPGFGVVAKAAVAAKRIIAKIEGAVAVEQGGVKIAESLFPFNPAGFSAGAGMIAHGVKLLAIGGGGGSGGGGSSAGGGGSGLSPSRSLADQQALLQSSRGKTVIEFKDDRPFYDREDVQNVVMKILDGANARRV